ncbi:MAG: ABC transporter ATP-binding protein, partial [Candidatus Sumerlaeales bacterium]|nr:ABC transporter ATP-binding protein [Candidatus Sumerlaeales bacterium]
MTNLASTPMNTADDTPLLRVKDLRTWFRLDGHEYHAVDGVSFDIRAGEVLGLVGESGCGKSVTSLSIMRLIPSPPGFIKSGEIDFCGTNLLSFSAKEMRKIRGDKISMIFQEPMTALNPLLTLGTQVAEVLQIHRGMKKQDAIAKTIELFERVRIPDAAKQVSCYPHQISGGMRQRVMIAMALACRPSLLIADEPTTALDVTVEAQILALLEELRGEFGSSILLITHDLG